MSEIRRHGKRHESVPWGPLALALLVWAFQPAQAASSQTLPPGFRDTVALSGLAEPTAVCFASDGRVFVAEKSGLIRVFASLMATSPTVFADLRTNVHNYWDRGLLGMALHPNFPATPYVYVLYTHDAAIGGTAPLWGNAGYTYDPCPTPPGATADGCVVSGRLSRLEAAGNVMTGSEMVLIEDWFQQYPSHSLGSLLFGSDGALLVSGGDGASFNFTDYGQDGNPLNPGGDPPVGVGGIQTPPTAEGGALRSQDLRTSGDPVTLDGAILRVNPDTGAGLADNPLWGDSDPNARRILAHGLRNPFRFTLRPGTNEIWVADVGWTAWEEINRIQNPTDASVENFGWPCYEGVGRQASYDGTNLNICEQLYATTGAVTAPHYTYSHSSKVVPGEPCPSGGSSISGLAFYTGGSYPAAYQGALFFSDYSRNCMWTMFPGGGGDPDPANRETFVAGASGPVQLVIGPAGDLFYVDFNGGKIHRIQYFRPTAVVTASPTSGAAPLAVQFDATGSTHPDPTETLTYSWDLDGDGTFGDSTLSQPSYTYAAPGSYTARVRVTDTHGGSDTAPIGIDVANTPPSATISAPLASTTWRVGDVIAFSGSGSDPQEGTLPASSLSWSVILHHCPSTCHAHPLEGFPGVSSGSFTAQDHEYPSHLEFRLTATDAQGLQDTESVFLYPETVALTFETIPLGLELVVGASQATPFTRTVIVGSRNSVSAVSPQALDVRSFEFVSWSDGGAQSHDITAGASAAVYRATYAARADLSISQSDSPEPVGESQTVTYSLIVNNAGPSGATSVSVIDTLPAGTTLAGASGSGWSCSGIGPVTCTRATLLAGDAPPISISVVAPSGGGTITNSVSVASAEEDPVSGNNTSTEPTVVVPLADLSIAQADDPDPVCETGLLTYTLSVTNAGPSEATSVSVADTLPSGAVLVSGTGSGWTCTGTSTVNCTRGNLSVGAAPDISIAVTAPVSGTIMNTASVVSATADPDNTHNTVSQSTAVTARPVPPATANNGPICVGGVLQLTASTVAGATYGWTGPNGFTSTQQNPTISSVTASAAGTYAVTVTVNGCTSAAATTTVTIEPAPAVPAAGNNGPICAGQTLQLTASTVPGASYSWTGPNGFLSTQQNPAIPSAQLSASGNYAVTVTVNGCTSAAAQTAVIVSPAPTVVINRPSSVCDGSIGFGASVPDAGPGATYVWTIANGTITAGAGTPAITFSAGLSGSVTLNVTVTDGNGCSAGGSATIPIETACAMNFYTITPCRIADTRNPGGAFGAPALATGQDRMFAVDNQCGIPPTARAISANVTVTQSTAPGHLILYPAGMPPPLTSSINYGTGQTRAANGVVSLGPGTANLVVRCVQESGTVQFILDVNGYFE